MTIKNITANAQIATTTTAPTGETACLAPAGS
jgi:hypothetical protein